MSHKKKIQWVNEIPISKQKERCKTCVYRGRVCGSSNKSQSCCNYMLITGNRRQSEPGDKCDKYISGTPKWVDDIGAEDLMED